MWEGDGDWTELQHIDPHSYDHNSVSLPLSWAAQPGAWEPRLSRTWSSFQHLLSNCNCSIGDLRVLYAGYWFSLPHLISNWLTSCLHRVYIIVRHPPSSFERHNFALNSTRLRSRLYPDIPRPDAPVIYTGGFPILTAWLGRRSIYNNTTINWAFTFRSINVFGVIAQFEFVKYKILN